ncbi:MAG TPA: hypothetical protein VLJ58_18115 [Ramlibacter sp.]|nr:hypothetical protein [Ramlibacter sp.]
MNATQPGASASDEDKQVQEKQMPPVPDEAGPHDVPDDEVIEKTLPGAKGGPKGKGKRSDKSSG